MTDAESRARARSDLPMLALGYQRGDEKAERELLGWLLPQLRRFVRSRRIHGPEIDDVVQHCAIAVLRALPSFRGDSTLCTFSLGIAWRAMLLYRRSASRRAARDVQVAELEQPLQVSPSSPHEQAVHRARQAELLRLIDELPPRQAEALRLRIFDGCSLPEIAAQTGTPLNTVHRRLHLARRRLMQRLQADPRLRELFEW